MYRCAIAVPLVALACGCGGDESGSASASGGTAGTAGVGGSAGGAGAGGSAGAAGGSERFRGVAEVLEAADIADLALVVGNADGEQFRYQKGNVTGTSSHAIGSAAKWLTAATVLRLVERGVLSLDDRPAPLLDWWTDDPGDARSSVTIRQLLSFTSGFAGTPAGPLSPPCVSDGATTIVDCAREIYEDEFDYVPGESFYYGPSHMQLLGAVVQAVTGKPWATVFNDELAEPLGMGATRYATPSTSNPRLSGGVVSTLNDYTAFVAALHAGTSWPTTFSEMIRDQTPGGTVTLESTPIATTGYEWHYGLGCWRQCLSATWQPACDTEVVVSSTGAFGWHPWIDVTNDYWAVLAMELPFSSAPSPSDRAIALAVELMPLVRDALAAD